MRGRAVMRGVRRMRMILRVPVIRCRHRNRFPAARRPLNNIP
jgi:hypothetical protein